LSQFEFYYNDWIDVNPFIQLDGKFKGNWVERCHVNINLDTNFFKELCIDDEHLKTYRIDAALKCYEKLGSKPALCFSGGIDSQATWQCFNDAGIDIDVYTLVFKKDLNKQDVDHAITFAHKNNINLKFIEIDILNFLSRENHDYCIKYKSLSPHFNTHYKLCNILLSKGYTGFVCGGAAPILPDFDDHSLYFCTNYTHNVINYINYSLVANVMCQGNFLGYYPKLAWAIALLTPIYVNKIYNSSHSKYSQDGFVSQKDRDVIEFDRYLHKIEGYKRAGFNIIPQEKKFTGFELVKTALEETYKDGWMFEKLFREPLKQHIQEIGMFYDFDSEVVNLVRELNLKYSGSSLNTSTGITV
jgi:hypothetical protein